MLKAYLITSSICFLIYIYLTLQARKIHKLVSDAELNLDGVIFSAFILSLIPIYNIYHALYSVALILKKRKVEREYYKKAKKSMDELEKLFKNIRNDLK